MNKKKMSKPHKSVAIMAIAVLLTVFLWAMPMQAAASVGTVADASKSVIDSDPITTYHNASTIEQLNNELKILEETLSTLEENAVAGGLTEQEIIKIQASKSKLSALDTEIKKGFADTKEKIEKIGSSKALKRHEEVVVEYTNRMTAIQDQIASFSETKDRTDIKEKAKKLKEDIQSFTYKPEYKPLSPKLPHRIAEPTKKKPYTGPGIASAYYSSTVVGDVSHFEVTARVAAPTSDDLADTIDANQTQEIKDLAAELDNNSVNIYGYVHNNIDYELYYGSRKGSTETLKQMGGNDFDQASLLIALYRASGIPARYVYGTIDIPIDEAMNWVGVKDNQTAGNLLATAGVPTTALISDGEIVALRIEHVWVEAYVPYTNYRGVPISDTGKMWILLDPSFKQYNYKEGLDIPAEMGFDANTFLNDYISTMHNESPIELYVQDIEDYIAANHPDLTYDDVIRTRWVEPEWLGLLPATLPYSTVTVQDEYSEIPDNLRDKIRFYIHDDYGTLLDYTARMPEIAGKRVTISYIAATPADQAVIDSYGGLYDTPPYLVDLKPVLKIAGNDTATGTSIGMGLTHYFDMGFTSWQGTDWIENYIISGNYLAIGLDTQSVPDRFLYPEVTDNETFAGEKLYRTAMDYLDRCDLGQMIADETMQMVTVKEISDVIASNDIRVSYSFGQPQTFEWKGLLVDTDRCILGPFSVTGDTNKSRHYMILTGTEGSISENRVFEDNYDVEAISAVKALEIASDLGIQIHDINSSNIGAILPTLSLHSSVKADIQSAVNKGWVVKVPATEFAYKNWTGVGWIKMDPDTGEGGYMISGVTSGGQTVQTWSSQYESAFTSPSVDHITANIISPADGSIFAKGSIITFVVQYTVHYDDGSSSTLSPPDQYVADTSEARYVPAEYIFYAGYGTGASIQLTIFTVEITSATPPNDGTSFTTLDAENDIHCIADIKPDSLDATYNGIIEWEIDDDPRDALDSGNPDDPQTGDDVTLEVTAPSAPNGRRHPLTYRIRASLTIGSEDYTSQHRYVTQDERDQCRQEYIDMGKARTPARNEFVNAQTYVNPCHFSFNEINSGDYSWAIFTIAQNLENIRADFGHPMIVNSGFRNPIHNAGIGGARESRHIYGIAADIAVRDFDGDGDRDYDDWNLLNQSAKAHGACVEPYALSGTWVHMDWRGACPHGW